MAASRLTWTAACQTLSVSPRRSPASPYPPLTSSSRTDSWGSGAGGPLLLWTSQPCRRTNPHKPVRTLIPLHTPPLSPPPPTPDLVTRKKKQHLLAKDGLLLQCHVSLRKSSLEARPCIFTSEHKETLLHKTVPSLFHQYPIMGKLALPALCHLPTVWGIILANTNLTSSLHPPFLPSFPHPPRCFPSVNPRIRSKAVLSVGVVLLSHYIKVMQVNTI